MTSFDGANPGYTSIELDLARQVATNLKMKFIGIEKTYGWSTPLPAFSNWPWTTLDYATFANLTDLTPANIAAFHSVLSLNDTLLKDYLTYKVGYDPTIEEEFSKAMGTYEDFGIITLDSQLTYPYKCLMSRSIFVDELKQCYNENKPSSLSLRLSRFNPLQRDLFKLQ